MTSKLHNLLKRYRDQLFQNIMNNELYLPEHLSLNCRDLIAKVRLFSISKIIVARQRYCCQTWKCKRCRRVEGASLLCRCRLGCTLSKEKLAVHGPRTLSCAICKKHNRSIAFLSSRPSTDPGPGNQRRPPPVRGGLVFPRRLMFVT